MSNRRGLGLKIFSLSFSSFLAFQSFCAPLAYGQGYSAETSRTEISQMLSQVSSCGNVDNSENIYLAAVGAIFAVNNRQAANNPELERVLKALEESQESLVKIDKQISFLKKKIEERCHGDAFWMKYKDEFRALDNTRKEYIFNFMNGNGLNKESVNALDVIDNLFKEESFKDLMLRREEALQTMLLRKEALINSTGMPEMVKNLKYLRKATEMRAEQLALRRDILEANNMLYIELKKQIDILRNSLPKASAAGTKEYNLVMNLNRLEEYAKVFARQTRKEELGESVKNIKVILSELATADAGILPKNIKPRLVNRVGLGFHKRFSAHANKFLKGSILVAVVGAVAYMAFSPNDNGVQISNRNIFVARTLKKTYQESPAMMLARAIELEDAFGRDIVTEIIYENQQYIPLLREQINATRIVKALEINI